MTKTVKGIRREDLDYLIYLFGEGRPPPPFTLTARFYVNRSTVTVSYDHYFDEDHSFVSVREIRVGNTKKHDPLKYLKSLKTARFEEDK